MSEYQEPINKLQEYKERKRMEALNLRIFICKSDKNGTGEIEEYLVKHVMPNHGTKKYADGITKSITKYLLNTDKFPMEVEITEGDDFENIKGYGSGFGDLWEWTYHCSLSKEECLEWKTIEQKRIEDEYFPLKTKPVVVECFADNGEHSHYELINADTGKVLWSEET